MATNPSEHRHGDRHREHTSRLSQSFRPECTIIILLFIVTLSGCGSKAVKPQGYATAADALADYESFNSRLGERMSASVSDLADIINGWHTISDSASMALVRDTTDVAASMRFIAIDDSVCAKIAALIDSKPRSLNDYMTLAHKTRRAEFDNATSRLVDSVHRFYASLNSAPTYGLSPSKTVNAYNALLTEAIANGFADKQQLFAFLREEDIAFRSFLDNLPQLGGMSLNSIRDNTTEIVRIIIGLAKCEQPIIDTDEAVILLTMRNNRRLMLNAVQCLNDIASGKVKDGDQAAAYQWMLLQPWISFDSFAYSLMSDAQWKTLGVLSTETPKSLAKLTTSQPFPIDLDELPSLLIKTVVLGRF